ncbi:unnamed protein product [Linum trigynum]|uniref:Uncharacterized protein n=1 Tax=Linum trigynum TaxID=586398 RepID=A0AAV2F9H2_9ROSI
MAVPRLHGHGHTAVQGWFLPEQPTRPGRGEAHNRAPGTYGRAILTESSHGQGGILARPCEALWCPCKTHGQARTSARPCNKRFWLCAFGRELARPRGVPARPCKLWSWPCDLLESRNQPVFPQKRHWTLDQRLKTQKHTKSKEKE